MIELDIRDLSTWILIEAYRNGAAQHGPQADQGKTSPGWLSGYRISRRAIYQDYFGTDRGPRAAAPGSAPSAESPRLAGLKKAALLARSVKQLFRLKLIGPPGFGGLAIQLGHFLAVQSEYIYLTILGVYEAESLLADLLA